ncbi:Ribonuclease Z [invertebrate metagenome]|uniref:Ribonuclease Z n=1 Tax=invertebrate metagenome TaxID=1711999 RepID=A0A2H9T5K0_9ZZZZ
MSLKIRILGCHSAMPRVNANATSQVVEIGNHHFLVDCAEGTQLELQRNNIKFSQIDCVFISHLHGDHLFGLMGLLCSMHLLGRTKPFHIYAPEGVKNIVSVHEQVTQQYFSRFPIEHHVLSSDQSELIFSDDKVDVYTIPLKHRLYVNGFLFREKPGKRRLNMPLIQKMDINPEYYRHIIAGRNYTDETGNTINNSELTLDPPKPLSYAFCTDTRYQPEIIPLIKNTDLLYHESNFLKADEERAYKTNHTTTHQAATIAREAHAGTLILGHYSARYKDLEAFRQEAQEIFPNVELAQDGKVFEIKRKR